MKIGVMLKLCTPGGLDYLFTKTLDEIWDFFEYLAHDTWEYDNAGEIFSHPSPDLSMIHSIPLDESHFGGTSYEHSHSPCIPVSCDYCDFFDYEVDTVDHTNKRHWLPLIRRFISKVYSRLTLGLTMILMLGVRH